MSDDTEVGSERLTPFKIKYLQGENSGGSTDITKSGSILTDVGRYATLGKEFVTVSSAYLGGNQDENSLTNTIFFNRHPERKNQPIKKHEIKEAREWLEIRDRIVRPIIAELKRKSQPVDLPLVLAGPIVRRATKNSIWFWIALSEKVIGIYTTMFRYDSKGRNLGKIPLSRPTTTIRQLGKHFWVALFEVNPLEGSFPTDTLLGYDIEFQFYNKIPEHRKLSNEKLSLNYMPFELPTLIIGEKNTKIAHGSCRRPGSGYADYPDTQKDAFGVFDDWMSDKVAYVLERPASLILTGDQIYADDVALPIFDAIQKLSYDIFGYYEGINFDGKLIPSNKILPRPEGNEVKSRRRQITHYSTSPIGFSTTDGEAHLLSFPEYASMYLLVWCPELWQKYCINDSEIQKQISEKYPTLVNPSYDVFVRACRRVMANCATYMVCDDHEFTDDYNLDALWEVTTKNSITGQQILSNATMTYFVFQAWGNDPDMFEKNFVNSIFNYSNNLLTNNGTPEENVKVLYSTILAMHWSFVTASNPKALCVDIRTAREFPGKGKPDALPAPDRTDIDYEDRMARIIGKLIYFDVRNLWTSGLKRPAEGKSAVLVGSKARQNIERLLKKNGFAQNDVLLMVLPTPFIGHPFHILAQELVYPYPSARYPGDWEFFDNNTSQRASLVYWLEETFKPSALVVYSGDVHYGSVVYGGYACAKSQMDAGKGNFKWKLPVIQITSSPIKNGKEILWKIMKAGEVPQWYTPEARARYSTDTEGHFVGAGFNTAELSGELGKFTVVHQNHFCVITMPTAQDMKVKSVFIGVKDGKLAKAETSIHVHNTDFMEPLSKVILKAILKIR